MSDLTELLKEYDEWKTRKAFAMGVPDSPAAFMHEKRMERILDALHRHLKDDRGDRYPLEEYLGEEDIVWLKSQGSTALTLD